MSVEGESEASVTRKSMAMPLGMASQTWSFWGRAKAPKARQNNNNPRLPSSLSYLSTAGPRGSGTTTTTSWRTASDGRSAAATDCAVGSG